MPLTDSSAGAMRHPRAALALLSLSQLLIALDATIVFVALDAMGRQLQMDARHLQWVVSAYSVAFGGCLLLGGRCADLLGKRRMYVAGMALFGLASLVGGLALQPWQLVLGRAGQGVAAALLFPATLSLINTLYAAGPERNRAVAVWSMASAGGLAAGALLGGVLTQTLGWNWVLWVLVPVAWPCALGALRFLPPSAQTGRAAPGQGFDLAGCLSVTVGSSLLVTALVQGPEWGFADGATLGTLAVALVALALFWRIETRAATPLMPLSLLRVPSLRTAMLLTMLFMSSYGVQYYFLALYFQQIFGWSPLQAGMAFLLPTAVCTLGIRWAERWLHRSTPRRVLMGGWAAGTLGLAWMAWALPLGDSYVWLVPGFVVLSLGQGASWTAMWVVAGQGVAPSQQGVASGIAATAQQVGAALGLALLVMVATAPLAWLPLAETTTADAVRDLTAKGLQNAEWGAALMALLGWVVSVGMGREVGTGTDRQAPQSACQS
ncbi:Spectinomycin tetracycline efflux pump [Delftia tsuruhatensis]|uniref:MFS transporter n=1 Tax=Delftia tsuruhatensis TaxID=180282 RepID=UPI001E807229|nr:MFS transporter [Delftia tsuruhatensis]CAB5712189.1 Spectinomycin tetracycline efflux pump [Delftia tsuruhatensis]CAC9682154.1 Spectinomycin tetracycline efflux pump [Delftia tsuruhatensis]